MALVPNFGRNIAALEPAGVDHLYPNNVATKEVFLVVYAKPGVAPADRHWAIVWQVGVSSRNDPVYRMCQIVHERGLRGTEQHLTNWGPKTRMSGDTTAQFGRFCSFGHVSSRNRLAIDQLAAQEPVLFPNGVWNCQSWVKSLVRKCVHAGVLDARNAGHAIESAMRVAQSILLLFKDSNQLRGLVYRCWTLKLLSCFRHTAGVIQHMNSSELCTLSTSTALYHKYKEDFICKSFNLS